MLEHVELIDLEDEAPEVITSEGERLLIEVLPAGGIKIEKAQATGENRKRFDKLISRFVKKILESGARSRVLANPGICKEIAALFMSA